MEATWRNRTDASPINDVQEWVPRHRRRRRMRAIEAVPDTVGVYHDKTVTPRHAVPAPRISAHARLKPFRTKPVSKACARWSGMTYRPCDTKRPFASMAKR